MSKLAKVVEIIKSNPQLTKKEMSLLVASEVGLPRQQAYAYIYNAEKKIGKMPVKEKTVTEKSRKKASEEVKTARMEQMKEVSDRMKDQISERATMQAEIDAYMEESDEYVSTLKSDFLRRGTSVAA
jgi:phage-related minor tail protein